jgi:hypothetical protein
MLKITVDMIMSWAPCDEYSRSRVQKLGSGREGLTPLEICDLDIPAEDRLWVLLRPEIIPETQLHILACHRAEQALLNERKLGHEPDKRSWKAIEVKRAWIEGNASDEDLDAARAAAWDAARAAARDAARAAAWAAARAAAGDAAWDAARAAARAAAGDAAWDAAGAAELEGVRIMLKWLDKNA